MAGHVGKLAGCLMLGVASLCTSVQAQPTPVLHLSFDNVTQGTNVINDGSGSGMDGTLNGNATIVPGGRFGNALQVSGVGSADASCQIANAVVPLNVDGVSTWTVAMWIKSSTQGGCWAYQGDGGWAAGNTTLAMLVNNGGTGNNGHAAGGVRYGQGWQQGTAVVDNGQWHHIVLTYDGTNKMQYVDGVLDTWVASGWATGAGDTGNGSQFWIGGGGPGGEGDGQVCLNGLVDEAYVFDVALSASDIQKLYVNNSLTISGVPVAVTVSPNSGLRGSTATITATTTPPSGTVTNATADLSPFGLTNALKLVQSSPNVFTNSFTVPNNAAIGLGNVIVTVRDTEPLNGAGSTNFFVLAVPPTNAIIVTDLTSKSVYANTEVSFHFAATNDAPNSTNNAFFPMTYAWYTNGVLVSTNPMGAYYTFLTTPGENLMSVQCIASVNDNTNYYSSLSVTSALVTLTVNSGTPVFSNGLKREFFAGGNRANTEIGNVVPGLISLVTNADSPGGFGNNYSERYSGYFIPPTSDNYVFFVAADDDTDLFLSTNSSPDNKQLVAQETLWSGQDNWQTAGAGIASQKRSDTWTNSLGVAPYSAGIPLQAGVPYYIEAVHAQGGGGDSFAITYQTVAEGAPADGSASRMTAANNNIEVITAPGTSIAWSLQPLASVTVNEGSTTNFSAIATSDAEMVPNYQWFVVTNGGTFPGDPLTGLVANGTNTSLSLIPSSFNHAQIYCVASTEEGSLSITSSVSTLTVIQSVFEVGYVSEKKWMDQFNRAGIEAGTLGTPTFTCVRPGFEVGLDNPGSWPHDSAIQQIGYFIAPTNGNYVFYVTSHDDADLFLSTDNTASHKTRIAQEAGWSNNWNWNDAGGGGSVISQKRSDQFSPDSGATTPFASGIPLLAGHRYYMEVDHDTSKWGNEQVGVTYEVMDQFGNQSAPADGSYPNAIGTNVGMSAIRCTYVSVTTQPSASGRTVQAGSSVGFSIAGTSDSQYPICSPYGYTITAPQNTLLTQWYKVLGGVTNAIPGAIGTSLVAGPLTTADSGAQYYCAVRALGYADNLLNPIWTNSQISGVVTVVPATTSSNLLGHFISGAANLNDTANYVAPGTYYGVPATATTGSQFYYFTNDVPLNSPAGAQSLYINNDGIAITNTGSSDSGYVVDTFDGGMAKAFTVAFWAKGTPGGWNPWVSKLGDNGRGWQLRVNNSGNETWTVRGTGDNEDMAASTTTSSGGLWHHYAGTYDGTTFIRNLYVDGALSITETGTQLYTLAPSSKLMIGARDGGNNSYGSYFTGKLFDVRIYNYALSQTEITNLVTNPGTTTQPGFPSKPVLNGSQLVITYSGGTLLGATNILGPWTAVPGATSPYTNNVTAAPQMFFKVQ